MAFKNLTLVSILGTAAQAAPITYQEINGPGESNVTSLPTVIMARNFGGTAGSAGGAEATTVNGITFEEAATAAGFNTSVTNALGTITLSGGQSTFDTFNASANDLGPALNNIFKGLIRADQTLPNGERDFTISLTNLQIGATYQLQLFFSSQGQARAVTIEDSSLNLLGTWNNTLRESIIDLSFAADQATETITLGQNIGDGAVISALSFSADPNPVNTSPPTDLNLSRSSLNAAGAISGEALGSLSTVDPDLGDSHSYALVTGEGDTDNASFVIAANTLSFNTDLTPGNYSVRIQTTDAALNTYSKALSISVIANQAPAEITLTNGIISSESFLPSPAGILSASDPNLNLTPADSLSFTLVNGAGDLNNDLFSLDADTGMLSLVQASTPGQVFSIRVRATDSTGLFSEVIVTPAVASALIGRPLGSRSFSSDNDTRVLQPNNIPMAAGQMISGAAVYIQDAANQNGKNFQIFLLRPTTTADEFDVVYGSGVITITNGLEGNTSIFTFPNGPIETQAGDIFAHYGRGIPYDDGGEGLPIFYPVGAPPATGTKIILGQGDYPVREDLPRDYAWAAVIGDSAPPTPLNLQIAIEETNVVLRWNATLGVTYRIEGSTDLTSWPVEFDDTFIPASPNAEFTLPAPADEQFFFRVIDASINP